MIPLRCAAFRAGAEKFISRRLQISSLRQTKRRHISSSKQTPSEASRAPRPPHTPNEVVVESREAAPIDIPPAVWYQRLGPITDFFSWFSRNQRNRPYTVQLCTSLVTYLCGDLLAQEIGGERYDPKRTLRMLLIGSISSIPGYRWYAKLFSQEHP